MTRFLLSRTALALLALCGLALAGSAFAQDVPPPPDWYHFSQDIPIEDGEFFVPGGTLGSLSIGIAENGIVGGAVYFYSPTGELIVQAIGGTLVRNDDDTVRETGEIAYVDLDSYALANGPCRGCAYHERDQTQTSDVTHLAWIAPRTIAFTVNGLTETAVGLVNGLPLLPSTDLSGTWLRMIYSEKRSFEGLISDPAFPPEHNEKVEVVRITRLAGDWEFTFAEGDYPGAQVPPHEPEALPPPGADLYKVSCADPDCILDELWVFDGVNETFLWIDEGNQGRSMPVRTTGEATGEVFDYGLEVPRVYYSGDRIVGRAAVHRGEPLYLFQEYLYVRIPDTALGGDWRYPPCIFYQDLPPEQQPQCNP